MNWPQRVAQVRNFLQHVSGYDRVDACKVLVDTAQHEFTHAKDQFSKTKSQFEHVYAKKSQLQHELYELLRKQPQWNDQEYAQYIKLRQDERDTQLQEKTVQDEYKVFEK